MFKKINGIAYNTQSAMLLCHRDEGMIGLNYSEETLFRVGGGKFFLYTYSEEEDNLYSKVATEDHIAQKITPISKKEAETWCNKARLPECSRCLICADRTRFGINASQKTIATIKYITSKTGETVSDLLDRLLAQEIEVLNLKTADSVLASFLKKADSYYRTIEKMALTRAERTKADINMYNLNRYIYDVYVVIKLCDKEGMEKGKYKKFFDEYGHIIDEINDGRAQILK